MRDRSTFLYFEPKPDTPEHAQCETCCNWNPNKLCFWLGKNDHPDGDDSCGMYGQGKPSTDIVPTAQYTPKDVGLVSEQTRCENCNAFDSRDKTNLHCDLYVQLNRIFPRLFKLDVKVKPRGCCNAMEPGKRNPKQFGPYGPIPDADDPNVGGMIAKLLKSGDRDGDADDKAVKAAPAKGRAFGSLG
jgi:hypothetical protein